jgi:hypothetical protein
LFVFLLLEPSEDLTDLSELLSLPAVFLLLDADLGSLTAQVFHRDQQSPVKGGSAAPWWQRHGGSGAAAAQAAAG